ncbi:hypothetical protein J2TS4_18030 [Paenibacillus sp. J2TS4]|nr:hypothetical protein J2TS4_18030 [Paenibacillus sp. J2TS4]
MQIGDYIKMHDNDGYYLGDGGKPELPTTGLAFDNRNWSHRNGFWYMVKVAKGLLISDRVWIHTVTWEYLNSNKAIQGESTILDNVSGVIRSLTGGVAYADENGSGSDTTQDLGGWPLNNEWDKYIVNFPEDLILSGKISADVFNVIGVTFCQETPKINLSHPNVNLKASNLHRTWRGIQENSNDLKTLGFIIVSSSYANTGFRPVFEYSEV